MHSKYEPVIATKYTQLKGNTDLFRYVKWNHIILLILSKYANNRNLINFHYFYIDGRLTLIRFIIINSV